MDSDRRSAQVERLEVVETGRRRRWSEDEKLKIVLESLQAPRQVAATARRYGISRSLLLRWRRLFQPEPKDATAQQWASYQRGWSRTWRQCRAARGWLWWSRSDLAAKAAVPLMVIHDFGLNVAFLSRLT